GQGHFDVKLGTETFNLEKNFLADMHHLLQAPLKTGNWAQEALELVKKTNRFNALQIPICIAVGIAFNLVSPHLVHLITKKFFGFHDYPGEDGLRKLNKQDTAASKGMFPYLTQCLKHGNVLPLLVSLVPLPLIFGLFNTDKWANLSLKSLKASF